MHESYESYKSHSHSHCINNHCHKMNKCRKCINDECWSFGPKYTIQNGGDDPFIKRKLLKNIKRKHENERVPSKRFNIIQGKSKKKYDKRSPLKFEIKMEPEPEHKIKNNSFITNSLQNIKKLKKEYIRKGGKDIDILNKINKTEKELEKKLFDNLESDFIKSNSFIFDTDQSGSGKIRSQYHGKQSKVMVKVPENVKKVALYSFKLKKLGFGGGLETGWKRAKQLATKESISLQDLRYMRAWFARHIYSSYPSYKKWKAAGRPKTKEWHHKHGIISWVIWGADSAFKWVNSQKNINLLNKHYPGKNYKQMKLK